MKRFCCLLTVLAATVAPLAPVAAQNNASQIAERQEMEEKFKSLSTAVEALKDSNAALQKKLDAMRAELEVVQEKLAKPAPTGPTQEDMRKLAEKILELDQKRQADTKGLRESVTELAKAMKAAPVAVAPPVKKVEPAPTKPEEGYEYVVVANDTLTKIGKKYRDNDIKVTNKEIEDANPKVNWSKLMVGQKIWIPAPKK
jgi:LysM repeat protein